MIKKGFGLLFTIFFILVISVVGYFIVYFSQYHKHQIQEDYLQLQTELYAKSSTEFAIQALEARDFKKYGCVNKLNLNTPLYDINMTFHYFFTECPTDCNCSVISSKESNGTIMINTNIKSKVKKIQYERTTLQKI